jgi:23S rRNA (adenine2503-C2)-methyltransferase
MPRPLALTAAQFAAEYPGRSLESVLAAYRRVFREGLRTLPSKFGAGPAGLGGGLTWPAPPARILREATPEGELIKFTQVVPRIAPTAEPRGADPTSRLPDFAETESVLIPMIGRSGAPTYTLCVSSQVGCAMGCVFCETAQMGLIRSLTPEEIVGQWFAARWEIGITPKNIVFMGMGEPMDNLDSVIRAIAVLTGHDGPAVPMNKITVSTVGRLDGIRRLAEQVREPGWHRLNLAVSVNAPNDEIRSRIMPINRAMPMADLRRAMEAWPIFGGAKICVEYVLIPGVNDAAEHARELAAWVRGLPACVNLIPYNPRRESPWPAPTEEAVAAFLERLLDAGAYAKRRRTKGRGLMGACGQLGSERIRRRQLVEVGIPAPR